MNQNNKIKILYVHHGGYNGGAPRSLAFLIDKLDKKIYEPYVLFFRSYEDNKKLFEDVGARVIYRPEMGPWHGSVVSGISLRTVYANLKYSIPTYFQMLEVLKQVNPDIIHLNSTCLFIVAKAVKKYNKNIPIVCHVREPILRGFWGNILRKENEKYVDEYIAIEKYDADSLNTKKNVNIIYNFVDFKTYNESVTSDVLYKELDIPMNEKIILYLARISSENGAYEMLKNLEQYIGNNENIHFCLVGAQFEQKTEYLEKVINIVNKYPNIHLLPFRSDVPNLIASSTILITPFTKPHFARSVIEAAAMGITSIVHNIGGLNELVVNGKTGIIYNNFEDLELKLTEIIEDDQKMKYLSENAIKYAHDNFDSVTNSNKTFLIYEKLLKSEEKIRGRDNEGFSK